MGSVITHQILAIEIQPAKNRNRGPDSQDEAEKRSGPPQKICPSSVKGSAVKRLKEPRKVAG